MVKTFVNELREVNQRIPRRLIMTDGQNLMTSEREIVHPKFLRVSEISFVDIRGQTYSDKPYFFQLGSGEYRGGRNVSKDQANLALGRDFKTVSDDLDILAMLRACECGKFANAYHLGVNILEQQMIRVPVAYFNIPPRIHRALAIDCKDKQFAELIERLNRKEFEMGARGRAV
jgi:acyl-CoA synthetase (AMP-forming)/AMP-acid ligase II